MVSVFRYLTGTRSLIDCAHKKSGRLELLDQIDQVQMLRILKHLCGVFVCMSEAVMSQMVPNHMVIKFNET